MKLDICLRPVKNQFKMEKYLNLKLETPRLRKHRGRLQDIGVGETVQKNANSTRTCNKQSTDGFHENGKFPHSKRSNQQSVHTAHRRGDKFYQLHVRQGVNFQNSQRTADTRHQGNKTAHHQMGKWTEQTVFKNKETQMANNCFYKHSISLSHQGHAS